MEEVLAKQSKSVLTPTLRFLEFDDNWQSEKVGNLCDCIVPGRNKPTVLVGDIPWITTPDITHNDKITYSKLGLGISRDEAKRVGSKIVPVGAIIMSCVGELGLVAVAGSDIVINQQLHAFIPKPLIHNLFLLYSLSTRKKYMDRVATKTAVPYMNKDNCNSVPIAFPSLPEQQKIASFLSAVDEKIQLLKRKKELLEQYKKGVMQQLFFGKLRFKDKNGEDFPDWEEKKLGEVAITFSGGTPTSTKREYYQGDIPFIKSGEIKNSKTEQHITSDALKSSSAKLVRKGDLLYALYGATAGESAITKIDGAINQAVLCIRPVIDTQFLYFYLSGRKQDILEKYLQGGQGNLSASIIKSIGLNVPMRNEQQQIAKFLMAIDYKIDIVLNQITLTQTFKKGLLQQMFV